MRSFGFKTVLYVACLLVGTCVSVIAQSSDQNFPTPVTTNEISGVIKARDIGDSRQTTYYYAFDGGQGDIFINVITKNLSGDIDVFMVDGLKPLTKMVIYADAGNSETGRLVYLRKAERLLLRIEGRTPGDDPASFRIKFAGSFIALAPVKNEMAPTLDKTGSDDENGFRVNSVGTIIPATPKPLPPKKIAEPEKKKEIVAVTVKPKRVDNKKPVVVVEDMPKATEITAKKPVTKPPAKPKPSKTDNPPTKTEEIQPDPLASIRLVIRLKDGNVIEHPMSEVIKFSVDKGVLTVITKNGDISRYSIFAVAKVTIE